MNLDMALKVLQSTEKTMFHDLYSRPGGGGAPAQSTMQARCTAVAVLPSPSLTAAALPPIHREGHPGREALSPGALPESSK